MAMPMKSKVRTETSLREKKNGIYGIYSTTCDLMKQDRGSKQPQPHVLHSPQSSYAPMGGGDVPLVQQQQQQQQQALPQVLPHHPPPPAAAHLLHPQHQV